MPKVTLFKENGFFKMRWRERVGIESDGSPKYIQHKRTLSNDKKTAEIAYHEFQKNLSLGLVGLKTTSNAPFMPFCDRYIKEGGAETARYAIQDLNDHVTIRTIDDFKKPIIKKYENMLVAEGRKEEGIAKYLHTIKHMGSMMVEWGLKDTNPLARYHVKEGQRGGKVPFLNTEERKRYLSGAKGNYLLFGMLGLFTGGRPGELLTLQFSDIYDNRVHFTDKPQFDHFLKNHQRRAVPYFKPLRLFLDKMFPCHKPDELIIKNRFGEFENRHDFESALRRSKLKERLNIPHLVPYVFRHTFAKWILQKYDIYILSKLLGHKSVHTTQAHYEHWSNENVNKINANIDYDCC